LNSIIKRPFINQTVVGGDMETKIDNPSVRKNELIEATFEIIARLGFEGLRIRDVAKEVGLTPATMYYYFPTKKPDR
jgi:AcrR family transcriptional regulator